MPLAPIVIFCYNRPVHLTKTLNALKSNVLAKESSVFIFCDGAKANATEADLKNINEVANICNNLKGFASVEVIIATVNKGLQNSVIAGLNYVLEKYEKVIVVEDDVVTSPYFLQFTNDALEKYKDNTKVLSVGSWNYYYNKGFNFFNHMPDTIAWGTWRNRWKLFEPDGKKLYDQLIERKLMNKFNLGGRYNFENMLKLQYEGQISSWAIRWTAVAVLNDTLSLYPKISLSQHIGFDANATNSFENDYNKNIELAQGNISDFDIEVKEDAASVEAFLYIENEIKNSPSYLKKESPLQKIKTNIAKHLPYRLKQAVKKIVRKQPEQEISGWFGNYKNWQEVEKECLGYDSTAIFEKVKQATLKVKKGEAAFERDSVTFDKIEFDEKLLTLFKTILKENNNKLSILDFGGALGSVYYQYRQLLDKNASINWNVVEQGHFVDYGKKELQDNELYFYYRSQEVLNKTKPNVLLLSSVLSYLEEPYTILNSLMELSIRYIVIDRNLFLQDEERLTKQIVPKNIYEASYPCRILSEKKVIDTLSSKYEVINTLDPYKGLEVDLGDKKAYFKGHILKLK
ncbi:MAG: methyltransferase, TIGR04325 family [Bacteroidia bacterium]|nr:methyltransferase, TIGR04325 family [Bacteroidia bacterium]